MIADLSNVLRVHQKAFQPVIPFDFNREPFASLDLSVENREFSKIDVYDTKGLTAFIENELRRCNARVGIGGYNEQRHWYSRNPAFNLDGEPREFHIGLDIWAPVGTPISTPLDATVHSFQNNSAVGDYGPTIVLQHQLDGVPFHTLYGHLTVESLNGLAVGKKLPKGTQFAAIGDVTVNGGWPPHLHLQIIQDMRGARGDFYGVINRSRRAEFLELCPDPSLLLGLRK